VSESIEEFGVAVESILIRYGTSVVGKQSRTLLSPPSERSEHWRRLWDWSFCPSLCPRVCVHVFEVLYLHNGAR